MIGSILLVAPHFAEYSERLAAALAQRCPTGLLINAANRADEVGRPIASNAQITTMPMNRRPDQARALLRALVMARRADVVIVHEGVRQFLKPLVWILRKFTRVALIVHDPSPHSGRDSALHSAHSAYRRWLRERADVLIVHGDTCRTALVSLGYPEDKVITINHGILMPPDQIDTTAGDPARVLMFGRMEAYKGVETLLDAADILIARGLRFHLVIAGAGPEQDRWASRMAAMPQVEAIARYLEPAELERQIARAGFVVAPYHDATQSGVLASTFANGRPVIASATGGLVDVVQHDRNGLLVPPRDAAALADAMGALLADPARVQRLAEGARHTAATDLGWDSIAGTLVAGLAQRLRPRLPSARQAAIASFACLGLMLAQTSCTAQIAIADDAPVGDKVFTAPDCDDTAGAPAKPDRDPPAADMYGDSEELPAGLVNKDGSPMGYAMHPRIAYGNHPPSYWHAMVPWGEIFPGVKGSTATNTRVEIRNLRLFVRPKSTGRWCLLQYTDVPMGAYFPASFANEISFKGPQRQEPDVGLSATMIPGRVFHFFAKKRVLIPAGGVTGVYSDFEARKILDDPRGPDDREKASIVANAGTDYWQDLIAPGGHTGILNADAAIGKFRHVSNNWQLYTMSTVAPGATQRNMDDLPK